MPGIGLRDEQGRRQGRPGRRGPPRSQKRRGEQLSPGNFRSGRVQLVQVGAEVAARSFKLRLAAMPVLMSSWLGCRAAVLRRAEYHCRRPAPTLAASMLLHRHPHRSGEYEQGQPGTKQPVGDRTLHQTQRYTAYCGIANT